MVFAVLLYLLLFSGTQDRNQESHCKSHTKSINVTCKTDGGQTRLQCSQRSGPRCLILEQMF